MNSLREENFNEWPAETYAVPQETSFGPAVIREYRIRNNPGAFLSMTQKQNKGKLNVLG